MPYLHFFKNRICTHCQAYADHQLLHASPEHEMRKSSNGITKVSPVAKRFRAFVSCANCRNSSMYVLEQRKESAAGTWITDGVLNRLYPVDALDKSRSPEKNRVIAIKGDEYGVELSDLFRVIDTYPKSTLQRPEAEDLPAEVHEAFEELDGVKAVPRAAAIACRRVLELACKGKLEQPKEKLAERIGQLQGQGLITREIAEWAKRLKDLLNQATHDGPAPPPAEAEELIRFTNIFIELLYVYPARVKRLSIKKQKTT